MHRFTRSSLALILLATSSRPALAGSKFTIRIWNNTTSSVSVSAGEDELMFPPKNAVGTGEVSQNCMYHMEQFEGREIKPQDTLLGEVEYKNSGSCFFETSKFNIPINVFGYNGQNWTSIGWITRESAGSTCSTVNKSSTTPNGTGICLTRGSCTSSEVLFTIAPGWCP